MKENVNYIIAGCLTEENKKGAHATELTMNGLPCEIHTVVGDSLTELSIQCPPGSEPEIYNINDAMAKIDNFKRYTIAFEAPDAMASLPGLPSIQRSLATILDVDTIVGTDGVSSPIRNALLTSLGVIGDESELTAQRAALFLTAIARTARIEGVAVGLTTLELYGDDEDANDVIKGVVAAARKCIGGLQSFLGLINAGTAFTVAAKVRDMPHDDRRSHVTRVGVAIRDAIDRIATMAEETGVGAANASGKEPTASANRQGVANSPSAMEGTGLTDDEMRDEEAEAGDGAGSAYRGSPSPTPQSAAEAGLFLQLIPQEDPHASIETVYNALGSDIVEKALAEIAGRTRYDWGQSLIHRAFTASADLDRIMVVVRDRTAGNYGVRYMCQWLNKQITEGEQPPTWADSMMLLNAILYNATLGEGMASHDTFTSPGGVSGKPYASDWNKVIKKWIWKPQAVTAAHANAAGAFSLEAVAALATGDVVESEYHAAQANPNPDPEKELERVVHTHKKPMVVIAASNGNTVSATPAAAELIELPKCGALAINASVGCLKNDINEEVKEIKAEHNKIKILQLAEKINQLDLDKDFDLCVSVLSGFEGTGEFDASKGFDQEISIDCGTDGSIDCKEDIVEAMRKLGKIIYKHHVQRLGFPAGGEGHDLGMEALAKRALQSTNCAQTKRLFIQVFKKWKGLMQQFRTTQDDWYFVLAEIVKEAETKVLKPIREGMQAGEAGKLVAREYIEQERAAMALAAKEAAESPAQVSAAGQKRRNKAPEAPTKVQKPQAQRASYNPNAGSAFTAYKAMMQAAPTAPRSAFANGPAGGDTGYHGSRAPQAAAPPQHVANARAQAPSGYQNHSQPSGAPERDSAAEDNLSAGRIDFGPDTITRLPRGVANSGWHAFEQLVIAAYPNCARKNRPCFYHNLSKSGCKLPDCGRSHTNPPPRGSIEKVQHALTKACVASLK